MKRDESEGQGGDEGGGESKRSSRNLNEKKRRDRFNILVQELAGIVLPENERKVDKTTVLKHAINFLQNQQSNLRSLPRAKRKTTASWQPSFTSDGEFNLIMLEALDSFILVVKSDGNIMYASHSVVPLLGYLPQELEGSSLFSFMHDETDAVRIWSQLASVLNRDKTAATVEGTNSVQFLMKCGNNYLKSSCQAVDCRATAIREPNSEQNSKVIVIVGKVNPPLPNKIVMTSDCQHKEFSYRLTLDWKYVYVDHRASAVIGFLPIEVLGTSFYEYCGPEELSNIAQYHRILIRLGKVTTCYYRHLTKGQSWVWLRSSCYICYNQWNSKPESITCTATVVNFDEVCANQAKTIQHDREHYKRIMSRNGSDSVSPIHSWPASPVSSTDDAMEKPDDSQQRNIDEDPPSVQKGNNKNIFTPQLLNSLVQTPHDKIMQFLDTQSDLEMESDEEGSSELAWVENVEIPSGLTSVQLTTHLKLLEEYKKIAEQIRKQERQLKMIRKLIDWSSLLLELGGNFGLTGESSIDSEASSSNCS